MSSGGVRVVALTATIRIGPIGFYRFGAAFYRAGASLPLDQNSSPARYYLACHALELLLKAFLLLEGRGLDYLSSRRGIRHDLDKAWEEAQEAGLRKHASPTECRRREIARANVYYNGKGFEYFALKYQFNAPALPDIRVLDRLIVRLLDTLHGPCVRAQ